ncbi:MAG: D-Ala-D-Ala carboxypeptidase family metallohydrolase [Pseudomonadota bacterium]
MQLFFRHWSQVPHEQWRWTSFSPAEIACNDPDGPALLINAEALDMLQELRNRVGPMVINSGFRTPKWNAAVGGAAMSKHLFGVAFDVRNHPDRTQDDFIDAARGVGFNGIGRYQHFTHIDLGAPNRYWED